MIHGSRSGFAGLAASSLAVASSSDMCTSENTMPQPIRCCSAIFQCQPAACAIARQKLSRGGEADLAKWRARVQGALLRRGFDYDFIRRVIAETAPREADGDG